MARQGENIRLRSDGRWEARAILDANDERRGKYRYFYGRSYEEARQKRAEFLRGASKEELTKEIFTQVHRPACFAQTQSVTFGEMAEKWLAVRRPLVKESTYVHYANQIEKHLLPELGLIPLGDIDTPMLESFLMQKLENGGLGQNTLSGRTVSGLKTILMQILKYAKSRGMLECLPECPSVPCVRPSIQALSVQEQETLVRQSLREDTDFSLGILMSLYAGLRIGEVCALQWSDFNFRSGTVTVQKTIMRIFDRSEDSISKTKVLIDTPKTLCSLRTIPLADDIAGYFSDRRKREDDFILTGTEKYIEPRVCLDRYKRLLRRAGLPDYNFHLLRHTFATRCVEKGVDYKSLSEFMGHSSVSITMQRYVHPSMELKREQINKLDGLPTSEEWAE